MNTHSLTQVSIFSFIIIILAILRSALVRSGKGSADGVEYTA
jgi:hypothetical protein